jgi:hypothetical protein
MRGRLLQISPNREDWENVPNSLEEFEAKVPEYLTRYQRISLPLKSVCGHFVVLLYPHRKGEPLPTNVWSDAHMRIGWRDQTDEYAFSAAADGRTRASVTRNGKHLAVVN